MTQALAAHFSHDDLLPRPHGGMGRGAVLALLAHGALVLALTSTVQWRTRPPEIFSAELWSAVPQAAAPLPAPAPPPVVAPPPAPVPAPAPTPQPAPPPPPAAPERDADIATEQARRLEAQRKQQEAAEAARAAKAAEAEKARAKAEADNKARREAEAKKAEERKRADAERKATAAKAKAEAEAKAEEERIAKQREENLRRIMGQAGNTGSASTGPTGSGGSGTAAQSAAPSASYVGRLIALIKPNIVFTGQVVGNPSAEVEVRAAAGGSIISKRLVKSSGDNDWDEAVLRAIDRTATLPRDVDGRVPPTLILVFRPGG